MDERRLLGMLDLAARSGKLTLGQTGCLNAVRQKELALILMDDACGSNTKWVLEEVCRTHGVPLRELGRGGELGAGVGRPAGKVIGVKDKLFARELLSRFEMDPED